LPDAYSRVDAVHNLTRSTLMFASLAYGCPDNLWTACDDRMHQPYRRPLVPDFDAVLAAARQCGACGAWLSGAGPSVAAAVWGEAGSFEADMRALLSPLSFRWDVRPLAVAKEGVLVE
jgi:homoserine kinase